MYFNTNLENFFERLYRRIRNLPEETPSQNETQSLTGSRNLHSGVYDSSKAAERRGMENGLKEEIETSFTATHESVRSEGHKDSKY